MNSVAQLCYDLDLGRDLVLKSLKAYDLASPGCLSVDDVPEKDCPAAVKRVMAILKFQEKYPRPCGQSV